MRRTVGGTAPAQRLVSRLLLGAAGALLLLLLGSWSAHAGETPEPTAGAPAHSDASARGPLGAVTQTVAEVADGTVQQVAKATDPVVSQRTSGTIRETADAAAGAVQKTVESAAATVDTASRSVDRVVEQVPVEQVAIVGEVTSEQVVSRTTERVTRPLVGVVDTADEAVRNVGSTVDAVAAEIDHRSRVDIQADAAPHTESPASAAPAEHSTSGPAPASMETAASAPQRATAKDAGSPDRQVARSITKEHRGAEVTGIDAASLRSKWAEAPAAVAVSVAPPSPIIRTATEVAKGGPATVPEIATSVDSPAEPAARTGVSTTGGSSVAGTSSSAAPAADLPDSAGASPDRDAQTVLREDWRLIESPAFEPGTSPG